MDCGGQRARRPFRPPSAAQYWSTIRIKSKVVGRFPIGVRLSSGGVGTALVANSLGSVTPAPARAGLADNPAPGGRPFRSTVILFLPPATKSTATERPVGQSLRLRNLDWGGKGRDGPAVLLGAYWFRLGSHISGGMPRTVRWPRKKSNQNVIANEELALAA